MDFPYVEGEKRSRAVIGVVEVTSSFYGLVSFMSAGRRYISYLLHDYGCSEDPILVAKREAVLAHHLTTDCA
jgi:hypothetical protein